MSKAGYPYDNTPVERYFNTLKFAGTIQAFVPNEKLDAFKAGMEALFGPGKCHILHIRPQGGCVVAE